MRYSALYARDHFISLLVGDLIHKIFKIPFPEPVTNKKNQQQKGNRNAKSKVEDT